MAGTSPAMGPRFRGDERSWSGLFLNQVVRPNYFAAKPRWQAAQIFAGVAGMSMWSAAPLGIALEIAFITAAIAAVVPASPVPFTPNGLLVAGTECTASRNSTGIW